MQNRSTPSSPLYQSIVDDLRGQIDAGKLKPGDQLLSIGQLCEHYSVSAITAKRVISELQLRGLVRTSKGRGTFVSRRAGSPITPTQRPPLATISLLTSSADLVKSRGFARHIWDSIEQATINAGLEFRIQVLPDRAEEVQAQIMLEPDPTKGMIFLSTSHPYRFVPLAQEHAMATVIVDAALCFCHSVLTDNLDGMRQLVDHLVSLGHKRLHLINHDLRSPNSTNENERTAAFRFLMADRGLQGEVGSAETPESLIKLVKKKNGPTALLFTQDTPAVHFIQTAREAGLRIPEDVSVVGFDGWTSGSSVPELTTLVVDRAAMGRAAVEFLLRPVMPERFHFEWVRVPGKLHIGTTVANPSK